MRLKVDENVPGRVLEVLSRFGHDVSTVPQEDLSGASDARVSEAALEEGRMLLTLDRGFGDVRTHAPGSHPGILVIHTSDQRAGNVERIVEDLLARHDLSEFEACNVIVEPGRARVRRPPSQ